MERATQKIKKKQKENENKTGSFLAIHLLNNPQGWLLLLTCLRMLNWMGEKGFIEKLYQKTNQGNILWNDEKGKGKAQLDIYYLQQ